MKNFLFVIMSLLIITLSPLKAAAQKGRQWGRKKITLKSSLKSFKVAEYKNGQVYFYFDLIKFREFCFGENLLKDKKKEIVKSFQMMEAEMESDTLKINKYENRRYMSGLTNRFINEAIQKGNLIIFSERTEQIETQLIRKNYRYICGPRCGSEGKRYFLKSTGQKVFEWVEAKY